MKYDKGDVIVPRDGQFPDGALVVVGYDDGGRLLAHPFGGGFERALPAADQRFRLADEDERGAALFRQAKFSLMESQDLFTGWTNGQAWNGWAKPLFERTEAERLIAWLKDEKARFDKDRDAFVTASPDGEQEAWPAQSIEISDGSSIKVYSIGAACWCWDEVTEGSGV